MNELQNGKISDLFSIRVKENFFKSESLDKYLLNDNINLKPLLFQLIHTLAVIQNEHKNFRHNLFIKYIRNKGASKLYLTNKGKKSKFFSTIQHSKLNKKSIFLNHKNGYPLLKTIECWYK